MKSNLCPFVVLAACIQNFMMIGWVVKAGKRDKQTHIRIFIIII